MLISDWSSDVCSSDRVARRSRRDGGARGRPEPGDHRRRRGRRSQRCRGQTRPLGTYRGDRGVKLLTGNDLKTGAVTWWTGRDWSIHIEDAVDVGEEGDAIASAEEGARRVNGPVVIDAEATAEGPRPAHIKRSEEHTSALQSLMRI